MKISVKHLFPLFLAMTLLACKTTPTQDLPPTIRVTKSVLTSDANSKEFAFISKPFRSSELSFRVGGPIDRFELYAGNYYKRGDIMAEIDPRDFHIRKQRTEATYHQAKAEFERIQVLFEKKNISASTFEKAKADYVSAKSAYETAVNELNDTKLIAPFNGYIGEVHIEKFQDVKATQPIISFIDIDQLKIEAYVPQDIAFKAKELKNAHLRFDAAPDRVYDAKVVEVSKSTTPNNLSYLLTAVVPNTDGHLLSGMSGKLFFDASQANTSAPVVALPQAAICHRPSEGNYVWVVNAANQSVSKRNVTLGELLANGTIAISQGLEAEETVAVSGLRFLSEGLHIQIAGTTNVESPKR